MISARSTVVHVAALALFISSFYCQGSEIFRCNSQQSDHIADMFFSMGEKSKRGFAGSRCPLLPLERVANNSAECGKRKDHHMNVLVIGGNKAYDCLGWARMFSQRSDLYSVKSWYEKLTVINNGGGVVLCGLCDQCHARNEYPAALVKPKSVKVHCVEPFPVNANMIRKALQGTELVESINLVQVAVNLNVGSNKTVLFPSTGKLGQEDLAILTPEEATGKQTVEVPVMTIDQLVKDTLGNNVPEVLTVDAEGSDPLILLSAAKSLATGRIKYIEFEYHYQPPWKSFNLSYIIDYLDNLHYDCFWLTKMQMLFRITGCYEPRYDQHEWSNVVCAHRKHPCWYNALLDWEYKGYVGK